MEAARLAWPRYNKIKLFNFSQPVVGVDFTVIFESPDCPSLARDHGMSNIARDLEPLVESSASTVSFDHLVKNNTCGTKRQRMSGTTRRKLRSYENKTRMRRKTRTLRQ